MYAKPLLSVGKVLYVAKLAALQAMVRFWDYDGLEIVTNQTNLAQLHKR